MKISVLLTIGVATFACAESAKAQFEVRESLQSCLSKATSGAAADRCNNIQACVENQSTTDDHFRECVTQAEATYNEAVASTFGGVAPSQAGPLFEPRPPTSTGVFTDVSDSDYAERDGEKGYTNN